MYNVMVGGLINRGGCSTFSPIPTNLTGGQVESMNKICSVDGCNKKVKARSLCSMHVERYRKYKDPLFTQVGRDLEYHGMSKTVEYKTWAGMIKRCYNKNNKSYSTYGGRGITVCNEWEKSFIAFYKDMGKRPKGDYQIDRIDNNGNYEPGNCKWIIQINNSRHTTTTKLSKIKAKEILVLYKDGIKQTEIAKLFNVTKSAVWSVIHGNTWGVLNDS